MPPCTGDDAGNEEPPASPASSTDHSTGDPSAEPIPDMTPCASENENQPCGPGPTLNVHQALSEALQEYGTATLPGSTTTKAAAIVMIVAFVVAHGLPWDTVDGLLRIIDALFGFNGNVLPKSKYLLIKLWSPQLNRHVKHHYYCADCGSVLDPVHGMDQVYGALCRENSRVSVLKDNGCFFSIMNVKEQLHHLISTCKEALYNELKKIEMLQCTDQIRDITCGRLYKNLRCTASRLHDFVSKAAGYYGQRFMTFNVHQLLHLAKNVGNLGPLWANSAFPFETGNGKVVKMMKAAKGAPMQILERVVEQALVVALH
ncbi:hypothetical protein V5799_009354 [Amblyomma americanum]|uniref:Uncharacterized protein n=1 Tax=Amblyomma americanum TaxID=6943 RepID=A0AAQ4FAU2_AMBAM